VLAVPAQVKRYDVGLGFFLPKNSTIDMGRHLDSVTIVGLLDSVGCDRRWDLPGYALHEPDLRYRFGFETQISPSIGKFSARPRAFAKLMILVTLPTAKNRDCYSPNQLE
jgi:hypothetical protein